MAYVRFKIALPMSFYKFFPFSSVKSVLFKWFIIPCSEFDQNTYVNLSQDQITRGEGGKGRILKSDGVTFSNVFPQPSRVEQKNEIRELPR